MKLRHLLLAGFGSILLLLIVISVMSVFSLDSMQRGLSNVSNMSSYNRALNNLSDIRFSYTLSHNINLESKFNNAIEALKTKVSDDITFNNLRQEEFISYVDEYQAKFSNFVKIDSEIYQTLEVKNNDIGVEVETMLTDLNDQVPSNTRAPYNSARINFSKARTQVKNYLIRDEIKHLNMAVEHVEKTLQYLDKLYENYSYFDIDTYRELLENYEAAIKDTLKLIEQVRDNETKLNKTRNQLDDYFDQERKAVYEGVKETSSSVRVLILVISIVSVVFSVLIASFIIKKISSLTTNITSLSVKASEGYISTSFVSKQKNEFGILSNALEVFMVTLRKTIQSLTATADSVSAASEELSVVMDNTARNTQKELSQMDEVSTALTELAGTSKEVSLSATRAEEEASTTLENVNIGRDKIDKSMAIMADIATTVNETAEMIDELQSASNNIGEVTEVIRGISEQTNLLALNAAIEAARAGEHGRGFAVVADEVRSLAEKTQNSTLSIQEIISKLQEKSSQASNNIVENLKLFEESTTASKEVNEAFTQIVQAVSNMSEVNLLISNASQEQLSVTEEVSKSTFETLQLVNENVQAVEDSKQAARELARLAEEQRQEISFFKF